MLISYTVDMRFRNAPTVNADVVVVDPETGRETIRTLRFVDDEGRAIHRMIDNPNGDGLVSSGEIDRVALDAAIVARLDASRVPSDVGELIAVAEKARRDLFEVAAEKDALDAQIAARRAELAALSDKP